MIQGMYAAVRKKKRSDEVTKMKKFFAVLIGLFFLSTSLAFALPHREAKKAKKIFFEASINMLLPADGNFKDIYGSQHYFPGIKAGFLFSKGFYLWGGCGSFSGSGEIDIYGTKMEAKIKQRFISFGSGYHGSLTGKIGYHLEVGGVSFKYKEDAMEEKDSASSFGFTLSLGVSYNFSRLFFADIFATYMAGSNELVRKVKIGGVITGIGFGIRF
jgi:opacity protein-like surface antigen